MMQIPPPGPARSDHVRPFWRRAGVFLFAATITLSWWHPSASEGQVIPPPDPDQEPLPVPAELMHDEHIREEFGINRLTTPSIKRLFEQLDTLGRLPYEEVRREIPQNTPSDRTLVALGLGTIITDGFLTVQAEDVQQIEKVGRAALKFAKALGGGDTISVHSRALMEYSALGEWEVLKDELAKTQADVEVEMIQLRDVEVAHLIALGGYARALEIGSRSVLEGYTEERAAVLDQLEVAAYFAFSMEHLHPKVQGLAHIQEVYLALRDVGDVLLEADGELTEARVKRLEGAAKAMVAAISSRLP